MKVSDYRKLVRKVETGQEVILDHLHPIINGKRVERNYVIMQRPSKDAVYRFLSGFNITGKINEGLFVGEVDDLLGCDSDCDVPQAVLVWKFNWNDKSDGYMMKTGVLSFENKYGLISKECDISIDITRRDEGEWTVNYVYLGDIIQTSFIKTNSDRYVIHKAFNNAQTIFEEVFWKDYLEY